MSTDDLLPELNEKGNPAHDSNSPPGHDASPAPDSSTQSPGAFDISTWVDEWDTTHGRVKLELTDGVLRGRLYILDEFSGREKESDRLELRTATLEGQITGTSSYTASTSRVTLTLSLDGNSFTATSTSPNGLVSQWSGKRLRHAPGSGTPGNTSPTIPTTPTVPRTPPTVPTSPTTPLPSVPSTPTTPGEGNSGGFRTLANGACKSNQLVWRVRTRLKS